MAKVNGLAAVPAAINSWSPEYLETLYLEWKNDAESVNEEWKIFFQGFDLAQAQQRSAPKGTVEGDFDVEHLRKQASVWSLVYHYRDVGHLMADVDPLGRERPRPDNLKLEAFHLSEDDLDLEFITAIHGMDRPVPLREIIANLEHIYCGHLGAEYLHIQNTPERRWIQDRLELPDGRFALNNSEKCELYKKLRQAEVFENFLHTRYVGQKRFSLEGAETLIPMLWIALETGGLGKIEEVVLGMAHRGRLNVLANIINKGYDDIFAEFEDNYENVYQGGGDVKYHKGYSSTFITSVGNEIYVSLTANPSHLEAVYPVVEGRVRAKQRLRGDTGREHVLPLVIHGDAAFAGQGIVPETLQMHKLPGYTTGGTIHLIVNNQIGFTTDPTAARSSQNCTDVAKMVQAPIFHVNAEDVDLCARVVRAAVDYRQTFHKDVIIDLWCYRKYGHNEGDEPAFTQPKMYEIIRGKKNVSEIYLEQLIREGIMEAAQQKALEKELQDVLEKAQAQAKETPVKQNQVAFHKQWEGFRGSYSNEVVDTTVPYEVLEEIMVNSCQFPTGFNLHRKVEKIYEDRKKAVLDKGDLDWGTAEMLAYGTLLYENTAVRLTGQDTRRGTFSHRHAVLCDIKTEESYTPLNNIKENQSRFCIYDSPLSEVAVLGFEYGYSLGDPDMLLLWEAQFGDFANGAQVIIDQFIASAQAKWERYSGIVLLLPHGYEGQGPEHSSARLERFLQLCADDNIQVANVTTPAQFFHLLRRQMKRNFRRPLVVMSPKSLLRHPCCRSSVEDFSKGGFQEIIDDPYIKDRQEVRRIVFCSGKVYYDLDAYREKAQIQDTAIVRLEQLYPFNDRQIEQILARYPGDTRLFWCQEEPKNMGAWMYLSDALYESLGVRVRYIGRLSSASPAAGSLATHRLETEELLKAAFVSSRGVTVSVI
jgi:2-oxoglutarate dehydrogenase E1 component